MKKSAAVTDPVTSCSVLRDAFRGTSCHLPGEIGSRATWRSWQTRRLFLNIQLSKRVFNPFLDCPAVYISVMPYSKGKNNVVIFDIRVHFVTRRPTSAKMFLHQDPLLSHLVHLTGWWLGCDQKLMKMDEKWVWPFRIDQLMTTESQRRRHSQWWPVR